MPQILVADVIVAARLQSLDFVKNYVAKVQIFPELCKKNGNYLVKHENKKEGGVSIKMTHLLLCENVMTLAG